MFKVFKTSNFSILDKLASMVFEGEGEVLDNSQNPSLDFNLEIN